VTAPGLQAVQAVGGVIPSGLLTRIQAGELSDPGSLSPASYHLAGGETVRDAASRAWSYLRGAWTAWQEHTAAEPPGGVGTGAARERWLLVLLRELGYGHVPALPGGYIIEDREYPVSHAWRDVPIHLLGPGADLDHRNPGVSGAARAPQAMVQELLNRDDACLWAILSNGLRLRLLRDSTALAGSAYLEFDLEAIFDGEIYPEFLLMWQLCHVSRLEKRGGPNASPADCWLETWRGEAVEAGARALERLRDGVEKALAALGTGFLRHPGNEPLRSALRDGLLTDQQYHRALLRLIYRLLFCFVAEDRYALLSPDARSQERDRYTRYFSTARLRRLSRVRAGGPYGDLWQAQALVLSALGNHGHQGLGLPALAGLFDPDPRVPVIDGTANHDPLLGSSLTNNDLLKAVRHLAWLSVPGRPVQPVDYRHLGTEELGSVYESLLELRPKLDLADRSFRLQSLAGNERKTTGSYYTPPGLVSALLDTALDPLLDDAVKNAADRADAERRLLALTVCDPACGSGHFLVAAARRFAQRVAQLRSGEDEPTPPEIQHALREVAGHCLYGVDVNDLAAELAKVSLWLEALEPGKPLSFLDARIRVGNSLLGTTPVLLQAGIPDAAFKELEGDDKQYARKVRMRNRAQASGQDALVFEDVSNSRLAAERAAILSITDSVDEVRGQARQWTAYETSPGYLARKSHADAWCAAFVWPLHVEAPEPPTNAVFRAVADNPADPHLAKTIEETVRLADEYRFFHWHLEYPEIFQVDSGQTSADGPEGWAGGFSCLVGNPPWEHIELKEQEFFSALAPDIAAASGARRKKLIANLPQSDPVVAKIYAQAKHHIDGVRTYTSDSGRYPLSGRGRINTYAVFAEAFRSLTKPHGRAGVIVPTGISTDATTQYFFRDLVEKHSLAALYDFENRAGLFPGSYSASVSGMT
jgi:N-6 DNA Methylase